MIWISRRNTRATNGSSIYAVRFVTAVQSQPNLKMSETVVAKKRSKEEQTQQIIVCISQARTKLTELRKCLDRDGYDETTRASAHLTDAMLALISAQTKLKP